MRRAIQKSRAILRKSHEKRTNESLEPQLNLIPWTPQCNDYANPGYTPIKLKDLILLNSTWDKNNSTPYFIVSKTDYLADGINFDERLVGARKVGVRQTSANAYLFGFDSIRRVIDGDSLEAKNFIEEQSNGNSGPVTLRFTKMLTMNSLFHEIYPYRLKPYKHQFSAGVTWEDYEHEVCDSAAPPRHVGFTNAPPPEGVKASGAAVKTEAPEGIPMSPSNQDILKPTQLGTDQKARHKAAKQTSRQRNKTISTQNQRITNSPSFDDLRQQLKNKQVSNPHSTDELVLKFNDALKTSRYNLRPRKKTE